MDKIPRCSLGEESTQLEDLIVASLFFADDLVLLALCTRTVHYTVWRGFYCRVKNMYMFVTVSISMYVLCLRSPEWIMVYTTHTHKYTQMLFIERLHTDLLIYSYHTMSVLVDTHTHTLKVLFCLDCLDTLSRHTHTHIHTLDHKGLQRKDSVTKTNTMTHKGHFCFPTQLFSFSAPDSPLLIP